jgi:hypothetical protein
MAQFHYSIAKRNNTEQTSYQPMREKRERMGMQRGLELDCVAGVLDLSATGKYQLALQFNDFFYVLQNLEYC